MNPMVLEKSLGCGIPPVVESAGPAASNLSQIRQGLQELSTPPQSISLEQRLHSRAGGERSPSQREAVNVTGADGLSRSRRNRMGTGAAVPRASLDTRVMSVSARAGRVALVVMALVEMTSSKKRPTSNGSVGGERDRVSTA